MTPDKLNYRIGRFFEWYSQRLSNLASLTGLRPPEPHHHIPTYEPDQHVLIGSGLDSLAKHWSKAFPSSPKPKSAGVRMQAFLVENANSMGVWNRVAAPMLRAAAAREKKPDWARAVAQAAGSHESHGTVRNYEDDPTVSELLTHAALGWGSRRVHGKVPLRPSVLQGVQVRLGSRI